MIDHDDCSQELGRAIHRAIVEHVNLQGQEARGGGTEPSTHERVQLYPHLIILHLNRQKVDVNRPLEGAVDNPNSGTRAIMMVRVCHGRAAARAHSSPDSKAVQAHRAYHNFIREALQQSVDQWGFAHLFDLHGQSHRSVMEFGAPVPPSSSMET